MTTEPDPNLPSDEAMAAAEARAEARIAARNKVEEDVHADRIVDARLGLESRAATRMIYRRALVWSIVLILATGLGGGVIGYIMAGSRGLWGALIAAAIAVVFCGSTLASFFVTIDKSLQRVFGVVVGVWIAKTVVVLGVIIAIRDADFYDPVVLFTTLVVAVVGTLAIDLAMVYAGQDSAGRIGEPHEPPRD